MTLITKNDGQKSKHIDGACGIKVLEIEIMMMRSLQKVRSSYLKYCSLKVE
ncbi:hypothetical protein [Clostridium sp. LS]|uniref:hypothetical protein n=1 Tax=Clostridium sp. LS TaxID=1352601 RepID=UPI0015D4FD3C|nr:hypothetical protein [Clostridium sp. LS]